MIARCATDFTLSANYSGDQLLNSSIFLDQVDDTVREISVHFDLCGGEFLRNNAVSLVWSSRCHIMHGKATYSILLKRGRLYSSGNSKQPSIR